MRTRLTTTLISNSAWALLDQVLRLLAGILVGIYTARYLGPNDFGIYNYCLSIATICITLSRLGMDSILVRELVSTPNQKDSLLSTAYILVLCSGTLICALSATALYLLEDSKELKIFILTISLTPILSSLSIIDFYNQSQLKTRTSTICKTLTLLISSAIKLALIHWKTPTHFFILSILFDQALLSAFLLILFRNSSSLRLLSCFSKETANRLLRSSLPMVLASIAALLYTRIDQFMIRGLMGLDALGVYSSAAKLYEAWVVFPFALSISLIPAITRLKTGDPEKYTKRLTQLFRVVTWGSICISAISILFADSIIKLAFGNEYSNAAMPFKFLMAASVFTAIGSVTARYLSIEHMEKKIVIRSGIGALLKVMLNLVLIPSFGLSGAAASTLVCALTVNILLDWTDRDLMRLRKIKKNIIWPIGNPTGPLQK
ncbi:flippase [Pseudomonas sp. BGr12]|uniref:flippase n=1 Tax=Pseudomonas sp. BGr12 TaxID=2936269 RepID=UPI0025595ECA|nr:flippase [Pseudomonas sp. BJa5]